MYTYFNWGIDVTSHYDRMLSACNDRKREESIAFLRSFTPSKYIKDGAAVNWKYPTVLRRERVCLDTMTKEEYEAYDYGCTSIIEAVTRVLDGLDSGHGTANEPWETLRRRLLAVSQAPSGMGYRLSNR